MKFPFIVLPRSMYEQLLAQNARLLRTVVRMKVAGGSIPRAFGNAKLAPRQHTEFEAAVEEAIANNKYSALPGVAAQLRSFAERELGKGQLSEKAILQRLRTWSRVDSSGHDDDEDEDDDVIAIVREQPDEEDADTPVKVKRETA